jgi:hypothetical protein
MSGELRAAGEDQNPHLPAKIRFLTAPAARFGMTSHFLWAHDRSAESAAPPKVENPISRGKLDWSALDS